jgi:hypothetical protein
MIGRKKHEKSQKNPFMLFNKSRKQQLTSLCLFVFFVAIETTLKFQP